MRRALSFLALFVAVPPAAPADEPAQPPIYQLRIYEIAPGKMPVFLERFATHNPSIFERNGIRLVGAWAPVDEEHADRFVYVVAFPNLEAARAAWEGFGADPEWRRVHAAEREAHGTVVAKEQNVYLAPTDYSMDPAGASAADGGPQRLYILRTYVTPPGKLDALNARFRGHTVELFRKHGLDSVFYATPIESEPGADDTLIYVLSVPDREAAEASWVAFRDDPEWQGVKAETEQDGPLTERVETLYMTPIEISPLK